MEWSATVTPIFTPAADKDRWFTVSRSCTAEGRFLRLSSCPNRVGIVTLRMEAAADPSTRTIEVRWNVAPESNAAKLGDSEIAKVRQGVVNAINCMTGNAIENSPSSMPTNAATREYGVLTSCVVEIIDVEWDEFNSCEYSSRMAAHNAILLCLSEAGVDQSSTPLPKMTPVR